MKQMSSFDIKACVGELQKLVGGKVEKIYHHPPDEIRIRIYAKDRFDLVLEAGRRIHITKFPKESPKFPTPFAMLLRKHLEGARIRAIKQREFDRVVIIDFERERKKKIVLELFSKGNIILMEEDRIIMPLKEIKRQISEKKVDAEKDVVRYLANSGFGGLYAEEICLRSGIDKKKKFSELKEEERKILEYVIEEIKNFELKPQIIIKDSKMIDVVPMDLQYYEKYDKKYFKTFNEALDEFYSRVAIESFEKSEEVEKLQRRLKIQEETLKVYEDEMNKSREIGDLIYSNYSVIEDILTNLRKGNIVEKVKNYSQKDKKALISIGEKEFEIYIDSNVHQNAEFYYEKAKKIKEKIEGLKLAINKTLEEIEKEKRLVKVVFSVRRKKEWFEEYRWFFTSDGFLAIGGRNAKMNSEIVSKHLESKDLFFHTQSPGAPVVILKMGQEASEKNLIEAAEFAAIYSSLWKEGKHSGEVYYVKPEQVLKAAKAGEFLPKGSFYIVGERNYIKVELRCAIGVELEKMRLIGGPVNAVKKRADYYVELEIGELDHDKLSLEISRILAEKAGDYIVKVIAKPEEIAKFLPPGRSRIV
ncbi:MAG: ribosome rescue protein RqcH [Archaeoglobaceae archaeon]|nr:NFACT family protein [Archaeoglobaceae archaeon]MDW7989752.1 ribosome rescue protein RqcH [Archaeoglobaceae archaeon]